MIIESRTVGPIQTNCYVVGCEATGTAAIIDAGDGADALLAAAAEHDLEITKILQTHAHIDHVGGVKAIKEATGAPVWLHPADRELWDMAPQQGMMFGIPIDPLPAPDHELADGQEISVGELTAKVIHVPGHCPGQVAFWFADQGVVLSGDLLFAGSIGRVDLPGSDPQAMKRSLDRFAQMLPDDTRVLSGHGPETALGREKQTNFFLKNDW